MQEIQNRTRLALADLADDIVLKIIKSLHNSSQRPAACPMEFFTIPQVCRLFRRLLPESLPRHIRLDLCIDVGKESDQLGWLSRQVTSCAYVTCDPVVNTHPLDCMCIQTVYAHRYRERKGMSSAALNQSHAAIQDVVSSSRYMQGLVNCPNHTRHADLCRRCW